MAASSLTPVTRVVLPSDQDATGRTLGEREIELCTAAIRTGTLTSTKGRFVGALQTQFAAKLGSRFGYACSSGSAAIHAAISAIDPEPGDEIITSSITDMGALTPILYQGAIPVFAEVDPLSLNVTAEAIRPWIGKRTKAIVVTHVFGSPCDMEPIMQLANEHGIAVIEDCAQAFLASYKGRQVGTIGAIGCFSLQQGKHMTCGEGGLVVTDDPSLARRLFLFINKCFGYGDPNPDHYYISLNSRMSEIQGALALGQFEKLDDCVRARIHAADQLSSRISKLKGVRPFATHPDTSSVFWKYGLIVDANIVQGGSVGLGSALKEFGIGSAPRYIQKPAFMCEIFQKKKTFGNSQFPFTLARPEVLEYSQARYPDTFAGLEHTLVLPWNERYTEEHVEYIASSLEEALGSLCRY
jgi:perosamine synthetase